MVVVLENPTNSFLESPDLQKAARALGKQIRILNATTEHEIDSAFASLSQMRADALIVAPIRCSSRGQIKLLHRRLASQFLRFTIVANSRWPAA
jgi:DNA-binding LacI/PurR family transcriptional regulator